VILSTLALPNYVTMSDIGLTRQNLSCEFRGQTHSLIAKAPGMHTSDARCKGFIILLHARKKRCFSDKALPYRSRGASIYHCISPAIIPSIPVP
jgi:hypothetical protein